MAEPDLPVDTVLDRGLTHIVENPRAVGDRFRIGPRLERIAQREHVAVGADAGIAKEVPGAADRVAALEDDKAFRRALGLQMIAGADPGETRADDEDVEMLRCHHDLRTGLAVGRITISVIRGLDPRIHPFWKDGLPGLRLAEGL